MIAANSNAIADNSALIADNSTAISSNDAEIAQIQSDLANIPTADCSCDEYVYHLYDNNGGGSSKSTTVGLVGTFGSSWIKSFTIQKPDNPEFTFLNIYLFTNDIVYFSSPTTSSPVSPTAGTANLFWRFSLPFSNTPGLDVSEQFQIGDTSTVDGFYCYPFDGWYLADVPRVKYNKWKYVSSVSSSGAPLGPTADVNAQFRIRHVVNGSLYYDYGTNVTKMVYWWSRN